MTLEEAARLAGGLHWVESRLFEVLGGWVASTPEVEVKLLFDRHSQHHAWRARQWWDRLPVLAGVDRDALCVAPSAAGDDAASALAALDHTVTRLAGAYRVAVPRLVVAYVDLRSRANPASDGSMIRTLEVVSADLTADWREGEAKLQAMLPTPAAIDAAAGAVSLLERTLLGSPAGAGGDQARPV